MSESPAYFLLAQCFTFMSVALRLSLGFLCVGLLSILGKELKLIKNPLSNFWWAWGAFCALVSALSAEMALRILPYANPFLSSGRFMAWVSLGGLLGLIGLQGLKATPWRSKASLLLGFMLLGYLIVQPPFSRSNQIWLSVLFHLPMGLGLGYLSALLTQNMSLDLKRIYHWGSGLSLCTILGFHYFWLLPRLEPIPKAGEFYPYINLYDWFLWGFVILYLGNLYIDYWLKERLYLPQMLWNYLLLITGLVSIWLNSSIFDTLAL